MTTNCLFLVACLASCSWYHNGATFYQHERFHRVVTGTGPVEVTLTDGLRAVEIGMAAQRSAETGQAVRI